MLKVDPLGDGKSLVEYIQHMGGDGMVVSAARVSFNKDVENNMVLYDAHYEMQPEQEAKDEKLIRYLANNKHSSPFQHCMVTLHVACPLFVYAQWRRHRTFDYTQINEVSRRYTSEGIEFYIPTKWRGQAKDNKQASDGGFKEIHNMAFTNELKRLVDHSLEVYDDFIENGVAREMARMVLPQNMYTRFYATMDLWNLYHFWSLRKDAHAQLEIRVYAEAIDAILKNLYPVSWAALKGE